MSVNKICVSMWRSVRSYCLLELTTHFQPWSVPTRAILVDYIHFIAVWIYTVCFKSFQYSPFFSTWKLRKKSQRKKTINSMKMPVQWSLDEEVIKAKTLHHSLNQHIIHFSSAFWSSNKGSKNCNLYENICILSMNNKMIKAFAEKKIPRFFIAWKLWSTGKPS